MYIKEAFSIVAVRPKGSVSPVITLRRLRLRWRGIRNRRRSSRINWQGYKAGAAGHGHQLCSESERVSHSIVQLILDEGQHH